jgi:hypothetical protein
MISLVRVHRWPLTLAVFVGWLCSVPLTVAGDGPPAFRVQYLGAGSPIGVNNVGTVAGSRLVNGSNYLPLVSRGGEAWDVLPIPSGATSVFPTDLNDHDVIVGVSYDAQFNAVSVRWTPLGSGYSVEVLPRLPGDPSSYATGINNLGEIVGARRALGYVPASTSGWLYSDAEGVIDLQAMYGLDTYPGGLNDMGQIIFGTAVLDRTTGDIDPVGELGPTNYYPISIVDINQSGELVGWAALRSSSLNIRSVYRYLPGSGWQLIGGTSRYSTANDINNLGDVGWGELGAGIYLDGLGNYALGELLAPDERAAGWVVTGSGCLLNDHRMVTTIGQNSMTGESGGVLLIPEGLLPPPSAPTNLQAVPHPATSSEPFNSINLSWESTSPATKSFELERSVSGDEVWTALDLIPPGSGVTHIDTTVGVDLTYDYRVRAIGVAGPGPWSAMATATSPSTPLDTTKPTVAIVTPTNGAIVSGTVNITAAATDNVGVDYLEISYWDQFLGQEILLGFVNASESLTVNWNTRGLPPATYAVHALAVDAIGNFERAEISVQVTTAAKTIKVTNLALTGRVRGNTATINGTATLKDGNGAAVRSANVAARWTLPGGGTATATATTDSAGRARFATTGPRGTYVLTITGAAKQGYSFDQAGSVLTQTITK